MKDQCSNSRHYFGNKCPEKFAYPTGKTVDGKAEVGPEEVVVKRDFTDYKFKYFPLTDIKGNGLFNAVCVKECPKNTYKAKDQKGHCVKKSDGAVGTVTTDFTEMADLKLPDDCAKDCFRDDTCKGFEFNTKDKKCTKWKTETKGDGTENADYACFIKNVEGMEEVKFMPNDDVKGFGVNVSIEKPGALYAAFPTKA